MKVLIFNNLVFIIDPSGKSRVQSFCLSMSDKTQERENRKMKENGQPIRTKEEIERQMQELKEKMQNEFIDKLYDQVSVYNEKVNDKNYKLTLHEQKQLTKIHSMITWMHHNA